MRALILIRDAWRCTFGCSKTQGDSVDELGRVWRFCIHSVSDSSELLTNGTKLVSLKWVFSKAKFG